MSIVKLALYGMPGAGKSTTSQLILGVCRNIGLDCYRLRLADPLYEAQKVIYEIAGVSLDGLNKQDGELLNFLGSHMRKINPKVLIDNFQKKLELTEAAIYEKPNQSGLVICDDMRRPEYEVLYEKGFIIIKVSAAPETCIARRANRGDIRLGKSDHVTEQGLETIIPDYTIENTGTLEELETKIEELIQTLI